MKADTPSCRARMVTARRRSWALAFFAIAMAADGQAADQAGLQFDQVFTAEGEPSTQYFRAQFESRGQQHVVEVWRDGDTRLTRRTDDVTEIHVAREPGNAQYQMVVLDLRRKLESRIAREDLYRLGSFVDWFDLAHGLRHPKTSYRLTSIAAPSGALVPIRPCRWFSLAQPGREVRICWSAQEHLPVQVLGDRDRVLWQLTEVTHGPFSAEVFEVHDIGFVRNDAHRDITGD